MLTRCSRETNYGEILCKKLTKTIQLYDVCACQQSLSKRQKADFFVYLFDGPARRIYLEQRFGDNAILQHGGRYAKEYLSGE